MYGLNCTSYWRFIYHRTIGDILTTACNSVQYCGIDWILLHSSKFGRYLYLGTTHCVRYYMRVTEGTSLSLSVIWMIWVTLSRVSSGGSRRIFRWGVSTPLPTVTILISVAATILISVAAAVTIVISVVIAVSSTVSWVGALVRLTVMLSAVWVIVWWLRQVFILASIRAAAVLLTSVCGWVVIVMYIGGLMRSVSVIVSVVLSAIC